jgi:FkbM family methyltransferase
MTPASDRRLAATCARVLLRIRERFFPRTEFATLPIVGRLIPILLRRARSPVVENVHGHRMFVDDKDSMGLSIDPAFEPLETRFCIAAAKPGGVVVDIGANIGYYTLLFAKHVAPSGKVVAFEPDPDNFRLLSANVTMNAYANVTVVQAAVSNANEQLELYRNETNRMDHRTYDAGEGWEAVPVPAIRLDDYFTSDSRGIDLIKMDIQGSEPRALAGMTRLLTENPAVVLVTEFWPYGLRGARQDPAEFLTQLSRLGFRFWRIDERRKQIIGASAEDLLATLNEHDKWSATNIVCSRAAVPSV